MPPPHQPTAPASRLAKRAVVVLLCLSLGWHWALLQGIAWTGMLVTFTREGTLIEAVQKTFDGQHACALCQKVKKGRETDPNEPRQAAGAIKQIDAVLTKVTRLVPPVAGKMSFFPIQAGATKRSEKPRIPPPRRQLI